MCNFGILSGVIVVLAALPSYAYNQSDETPLRNEIRAIERLLPVLGDRAPALFELAHDYAVIA